MDMLNDTSGMQSAKPTLWEMGPIPFFLQQINWRKNTEMKPTDLKRLSDIASEYNVWTLFGYRVEQTKCKILNMLGNMENLNCN